MVPKLLIDGYRPTPKPRADQVGTERGYQPSSGGKPSLPPPPPPNTTSSIVKPKD